MADEPTGNLDSQSGDDVIELLRYSNQTLRRTVILVTHNPAYLPVGDQLLTMEDGVVHVAAGSDMQTLVTGVLTDFTDRMKRWARPGGKQ